MESLLTRRFDLNDAHFNKRLAQIRVTARMSPFQKELFVEKLKILTNDFVGMCGDGANDC